MKREIKFRAYSNYSKKMYIPTTIEWCEDGKIDVTVYAPEITKNLPEDCMVKIVGNEGDKYRLLDFELMQFTGLKDKNGVEIYEGDFVEMKTPRPALDTICVELVTEKKNVFPAFSQIKGDFLTEETQDSIFVHSQEYISLRNAVVIGNIHENPELLAESK